MQVVQVTLLCNPDRIKVLDKVALEADVTQSWVWRLNISVLLLNGKIDAAVTSRSENEWTWTLGRLDVEGVSFAFVSARVELKFYFVKFISSNEVDHAGRQRGAFERLVCAHPILQKWIWKLRLRLIQGLAFDYQLCPDLVLKFGRASYFVLDLGW